MLAVATSAYLAAVYLAADARRAGREPELERQLPLPRARGRGLLAGAVALGGLAVVHADAHHLYHGPAAAVPSAW